MLLRAIEASLCDVRSSFHVLVTPVYGAVLADLGDVPVSVLVARRVTTTFDAWSDALVRAPPTHAALIELVEVFAAFSEMVRRGAGDLRYVLRDLHWKNLGVMRGPTAAEVVLLDFETCCALGTNTNASSVYGLGVKSWFKGLESFVEGVDSAQRGPCDAWKWAPWRSSFHFRQSVLHPWGPGRSLHH